MSEALTMSEALAMSEALEDRAHKLNINKTLKNMSLTEKINNDIKEAMKAREKEKLEALRDIKAKLIIEAYMPKMMSEDEIRKVVQDKIAAAGASGPQDMGKVMGPIMGALNGKADGKVISDIVKQELNK